MMLKPHKYEYLIPYSLHPLTHPVAMFWGPRSWTAYKLGGRQWFNRQRKRWLAEVDGIQALAEWVRTNGSR